MVIVKLFAGDIRILQSAKTEPELRGAVNMILTKVEEAEALRSLGKTVVPTKRQSRYTWKQGFDFARTILGDNVTMPPFPDGTWYERTNRCMREFGIDEDYVRRLAEHARDHMRMPIKFQFLVGQPERILAGEWDIRKPSVGSRSAPLPLLPD